MIKEDDNIKYIDGEIDKKIINWLVFGVHGATSLEPVSQLVNAMKESHLETAMSFTYLGFPCAGRNASSRKKGDQGEIANMGESESNTSSSSRNSDSLIIYI